MPPPYQPDYRVDRFSTLLPALGDVRLALDIETCAPVKADVESLLLLAVNGHLFLPNYGHLFSPPRSWAFRTGSRRGRTGAARQIVSRLGLARNGTSPCRSK